MQLPSSSAPFQVRGFQAAALGFVLAMFLCLGTVASGKELPAGDRDIVRTLPEKALTFDDVRPTLESRCIVCHGCYDAPCQLKLSSMEGVKRGANKKKVYDKKRFTWQQPSRLFIDAETIDQWRAMEFFGVVNADKSLAPEENLNNSLLYKMLNLKQRHPQPGSGPLPADFDISLDRKQVCATSDEFDKFASEHPLWGMPYALPDLPESDYKQLVSWLAQGAQPSAKEMMPSDVAREAIESWEEFFNDRSSNKRRLVSRYIYEHLVLAHLHFRGAPEREFFRLVRSRTPSGQPIDEIPTVRPYDAPGGEFYYRLRLYPASIVDKSHIVYELSDARRKRYEKLFLQPEGKPDWYEVDGLPGYDAGESSNVIVRFWHKILKLTGLEKPSTPFETFAAIPPRVRYRFLLDDARFFINGFIKGPVCRGVGALSSIEDHFWVFFLKPENPTGSGRHDLDSGFLRSNDQLLHLPTELANTNRLLAAWIKYWPNEQQYMQAKFSYYQQKKVLPININKALNEFVWDGVRADGTVNRNAALTVFRNLDSASVNYGLLGDEPETAWILDYSVFERLHYLLVAGYNTFGTLGHQASARLYMDFLRTEGEDTFLFFLPVAKRKELYDSWHGVVRKTTREQDRKTSQWLDVESVSGYRLAAARQQHELFSLLREHIGAKSPDAQDLNRCNNSSCFTSVADKAMQRLANLTGKSSEFLPLQYFPALSYVRVGGKDGVAYSLIYNKSYKQYEQDSFIKEVIKRDAIDMSGDTLTVLRGLAGAYPNLFFDVKSDEVGVFVTACEQIRNQQDFDKLVERFGVRRTNGAFWEVADWFQSLHVRAHPIESGILDLSRYEGR